MKLRIKKGLFTWHIINEENVIVAKVRNKNLLSPAKIVTDQNGNAVFTVNIVDDPLTGTNYSSSRQYVIYQNEQPVAAASISSAQKNVQKNPKAFTLRPPQVNEMEIATPYGIWSINRQKDNSIIVTDGKKILGTITAFFSLQKKYLEHFSGYDPAFWAGIYVLVEYMMHEDDIIVV